MKYKKGKKGVSRSLYSTLPETMETLHAKEASELTNQVTPLSTENVFVPLSWLVKLHF